jgi:hypothetical protein
MGRYKRYMMVSFGDGVNELKDMVEFSSDPGEKIGTLLLPGVLISSFVSKMPKSEMESMFKSIPKVSFFVMDYDEGFVYLERPELLEQLKKVYDTDLLKNQTAQAESIATPWTVNMTLFEKDIPSPEGVTYDVASMNEQEKDALMDELLDRYDELNEYEKSILKKLSE